MYTYYVYIYIYYIQYIYIYTHTHNILVFKGADELSESLAPLVDSSLLAPVVHASGGGREGGLLYGLEMDLRR